MSTNSNTFTTAWKSWLARITPRYVAYAVSILAVTFAAVYNSYGHQVDVAEWAHQTGLGAILLPTSVDGLLFVASLAMAEDKANGRKPRGWARFAFWLGAGVSIAANASSILVHFGLDPLSLAVSAWPPVALLIVVEIMARPGKVKPPEKNPARVEGGKKAAVTRTAKKSSTTRTRTPRAPRAANVPNTVAEVMSDAEKATAPTSPAPTGR